MSRQDKTTTEKHTKMLREMVKRPENKVCADCKRNDPRWASWNIGVFLCIRCSGIHRGMGTHISKVKSVDLDTWTPEQMQSIQKWGNHRANLYWEAHLKLGHVPPEHKIESFIRSKYESRRWALEGPIPSEPSILEDGGSNRSLPSTQSVSPPPAQKPANTPRALSPSRTSRQPQAHQLLSTAAVGRPQPIQQVRAPIVPDELKITSQAQSSAPQNDLFSLDFHSPSPAAATHLNTEQAPKKDVKQDILSLFSTPSPSAHVTAPSAFGQFSNLQSRPQNAESYNQWGQSPPQQPQPQPTSLVGSTGTGMWGVQSGWSAPSTQASSAQPNMWGNSAASQSMRPQQQQNTSQGLFETQSVWGASGGAAAVQFGLPMVATSTTASQKKDDVFGDLWGGFK